MRARLLRFWTVRALFTAGVVLRLVAFGFLQPTNNDTGHLDNLQFMQAHHRLPLSDETGQAYHPPLAYVLAYVPFVLGGQKAAQALSLAFSLATLWVLYRLLNDPELVRDPRARVHGMAFASLTPEFLFFGLFISNDPLSFMLGALSYFALWRMLAQNRHSYGVLVLLCTLGLLTKQTFLAFIPAFALAIFLQMRRLGWATPRALPAATLLVMLSIGLGSYKFVENEQHFGKPMISNLDIGNHDWADGQRRYHGGLASYYHFDLFSLVRNPTGYEPVVSYPMMLYSTLWFVRIKNANIATTRFPPFKYIGSTLYVIALLPTLLCLRGVCLAIARGGLAVTARAPALWLSRELIALVGALLVVGYVGLLFVAVAKYHVWSIMQARLILPAGAALLVAYDDGISEIPPGSALDQLARAVAVAIVALYLAMYTVECAYHVTKTLDPQTVHTVKAALGLH